MKERDLLLLTKKELPLSNKKKPLCKLIDTKILAEYLDYGVLALASFKRKKLKEFVPIETLEEFDFGQIDNGMHFNVYYICSLA